MAESYFQRRARELGLNLPAANTSGTQNKNESYFTRRSKELGLNLDPQAAQSQAAPTSNYASRRLTQLQQERDALSSPAANLKPETTRHIQDMQEKRLSPTNFNAPVTAIVNPTDQLNAALNFTAPRPAPPSPMQRQEPQPTGIPSFQQQVGNIQSQVGTGQSATDKWLQEQKVRRQERAQDHPVYGAIDSVVEPVNEFFDRLQTLPGISGFLKGANAAATGNSGFAPPVTGSPWVNKPAELIGGIAGLASIPGGGLGQNQVSAPIQIGQQFTRDISNPLARVAARGITEGTLGGISGSLAAGQSDLDELSRNALLGGALGLGGEALAGLPGALARNARNAAQGVTRGNLNAANAIESAAASVPTGRLKVQGNTERLSRLIEEIRPIVTERMTPPLENPNQLSKWLQPHLNASLNQIRKLSYEDMRQLATEVQRSLSVEDTARQVARERGVDLDALLNQTAPTFRQEADRMRLGGVAGALEAPQNVKVALNNTERSATRPATDTVENISPLTSREADAEKLVKLVQEPRIRDKVYSFLDEQEKAARERIAKRRGRLNSTPLPEWGDMAIIGAAKLGKGTIKAADWTEEMVKEFGEQFRPIANQVYKASKEKLRQQERLASKEGQAAETFNTQAIGNENTFRNKVTRGRRGKPKTPLSKRIEHAQSQLTDDVVAFATAEKQAKGTNKLSSAEKSLYKSARLYKGVSEKAAQVVRDRLTPIMNQVEKAGYTSEDVGDYLLAKHAQDVNSAGYKSGFTNQEINKVIDKYENVPELEAARQQLVKLSNDMLDELVDSQMHTPALRDALRERWKNYVPLFRDLGDDPETFSNGISQALATIGDPIQRLKGSENNVIDPLENMIKNIYKTITASERNKVRLQLSALSKAPNGDQVARKLAPGEDAARKNVITVREAGEPVKYEVNPEVYRAFNNLDKESSNTLLNMLSAPASVLRAGATLTPEFSLRNPFRDINQAYVTSKSGFNPFIDFPIGLAQTIKKGKYYKGFIDNMGGYGNSLSQDTNGHRKALEEVLKEKPSSKFVNIVNPKAWISLLRTINDVTESATKVGEFRKAIRKGETPQEAAYRARDLMDFAKAGSAIRPTNRIVAFLNANIQGKSKLLRSIKENPWGTTTRMITGVTLPTIAFYQVNKLFANDKQQNTIDEAPDWLKNSFWLVAVPGTDTVARIPKPFDIAPVFANLPERIMDNLYRDNPVEFGEWAKQSLSSAALPTMITGLQPLIEGMTGYSFFRQGNIVPQREAGLERKDQYDPVRTTETAKLLASGINKLTGGQGAYANFSSPRVVDNTIKGFTAGLGTYVTNAVDSILTGMPGPAKLVGKEQLYTSLVNRPVAPEKRAAQLPFASSFLADPLGSTKSTDEFYKELDKLSRKENSAQQNGATPTKIGKKTVYLNQQEAQRFVELNNTADDVSDINKEIREIEASRELTAKQKRDKIEPLLDQRNKLAQSVMNK